MTKWLDKLWLWLTGLDYPDPVEGQIWKSDYNSAAFIVHRVSKTHSGMVVVDVRFQRTVYGSIMEFSVVPANYCNGIDQWRYNLRNEKRVLV